MDSATFQRPTKKHIRAQEGPQREFGRSRAETVIYGGSAFGGKTWILVYDPLKWVHDPKFRAVIFRRSYPQITSPGGLWDEASEWYPLLGGKPLRGEMSWRFPSGAIISFRHLEHEDTKYDWQGSQVPYFGFDELSHFTESIFTYVAYSRGRTQCTVQPHVRGTCNPDPGWLKTFLAPWVDKEFPGPKAESGEVRWFIQDGYNRIWVPPGTPNAKSLTFIRASIFDNKIGLAKNPRYLSNLHALPPVDKARLLYGDWDVKREGLVYPDFESCIVERPDSRLTSPTVGGVDFGYNHPFAAVYGCLDDDDVLWITGCRYKRETTTPAHAEALPRSVRYWCDPSRPDTIREFRNLGHTAVPCVHMSVRGGAGTPRTPVLYGIDLVTQRMRTGRLKIVRETCLPLVRELSTYCYDPEKPSEEPVKEDDHACDALRYLCVGLDRGKAKPYEPPTEKPNLEDPSLWA